MEEKWTMQEIVSLDQVLQIEKVEFLQGEIIEAVKSALSEAIHNLVSMREREGQELRHVMLQYKFELEQQIIQIRKEAPQAVAKYRERLLGRLHEIPITAQLVVDAYEKFKVHNTNRYYLLTTANMDAADWDAIDKEVARISQIHGCQVIVNGVYTTLKYYLRLMKDPAEFIDKYVELLKLDKTIKFQHKTAWNDLVSGGIA